VRRRKYSLLAQPFAFFENIWKQFAVDESAALLLAEHDGTVVGGTFYVEWAGTLYYKFNASSADDLSVRPNDVLTWQGIVHGCGRGLSRLDFGQSDLHQTGLVRYKEKFATEVGTITTMSHQPANWHDPAGESGGMMLGALTSLLTSDGVPDDIYKEAGALLYRNFC
jgi:CelD/BcsL family acetyltransferase involved in cellulose biosynthesis